ncbi:TetR/AcrR family transcriptional regulator [Actinomycetospora sp. TBRC 11914]|uniref:TetR/AcrR family transcriptional regulator n=1 Tax=Actinomycetospora sp. TBRC 11914 TaxID=2729387 RepID=UPI00145F891C|nr:TetR/AcrR family transcriptional regulator [Actinomycetospora sp. TBRC 11914]NMO93584.1 TetR/AcrR family transcriptional regulator [Actinomycetospora sp. TBRC 11914]
MDVQAADLGELPPLSTRTRKRQERRDRVYDAAIALFVEHGFDQTSMDDIAARAVLGRTTVFNHFPRKAAFLEEWALRRRQRAAAALGDPDHDPDHAGRSLRDVLERYFAGLAEVNLETRRETRALLTLSLNHSDVFLGHTLGRDLAALVTASGEALRPSTDAAQVGRLLALGYYSAVVRWIHVDPEPFRLDAELTAVLDTVLSGALDR